MTVSREDNPFARLTKHERAVMALIFDGVTNAEIARTLNRGIRTVELDRARIMKKVSVTSLALLIRKACEVGFPNDPREVESVESDLPCCEGSRSASGLASVTSIPPSLE